MADPVSVWLAGLTNRALKSWPRTNDDTMAQSLVVGTFFGPMQLMPNRHYQSLEAHPAVWRQLSAGGAATKAGELAAGETPTAHGVFCTTSAETLQGSESKLGATQCQLFQHQETLLLQGLASYNMTGQRRV
jgi:hypothetical protein